MALILLLGGFLLLVLAPRFGSTVEIFRNIRLDRSLKNRVIAAANERDARDREDAAGYGRIVGVIAIIAGLWALLPFVPTVLPFSIFAAASGLCSLAAFTHAKHSEDRRIAILEPRRAAMALPRYAIILGFVSATACLTALPSPYLRWSAVVASLASLLLTYVGTQMAELPSRLQGRDIPIERFVDQRIREYRARTMVSLGGGIPFIFLPLAGVHTRFAAIGMFVAVAAAAPLLVMRFRAMFGRPSASELRALGSTPSEMVR